MKKCVVFVFFLLLLTGCGLDEDRPTIADNTETKSPNLETKTLSEFYKKNLSDVTKLTILDGNSGKKKITTDKVMINEFLSEIKDIKFIPQENQEKRDGFRYSITLFQNQQETFQFGLRQVNQDYYYTDPDIKPIIDDFYKKLK